MRNRSPGLCRGRSKHRQVRHGDDGPSRHDGAPGTRLSSRHFGIRGRGGALQPGASQGIALPLAFIFPAEGTFWSDHPYCILDRADWVTPEMAEAARLFREFLRHKDQQLLATEHLLRPLDKALPAGSGLTLSNGTLPDARPETVPPFEVPRAETAAAITRPVSHHQTQGAGAAGARCIGQHERRADPRGDRGDGGFPQAS